MGSSSREREEREREREEEREKGERELLLPTVLAPSALLPSPGALLHIPWEKEPLAVLMLTPYLDSKSWQGVHFIR